MQWNQCKHFHHIREVCTTARLKVGLEFSFNSMKTHVYKLRLCKSEGSIPAEFSEIDGQVSISLVNQMFKSREACNTTISMIVLLPDWLPFTFGILTTWRMTTTFESRIVNDKTQYSESDYKRHNPLKSYPFIAGNLLWWLV